MGGLARRITGERRCLSPRHSPHADGRLGSQVRDPYGSRCVLGLLGGRFAHGAGKAPCSGTVHGDSAGTSRGTCCLLGVSCALQQPVWTDTGLWGDRAGSICRWGSDHRLLTRVNPVSGLTAGNTTHLPLPSTTSGRSLCCASRVLPTRRISGLILDQVRRRFCTDAQPSQSSRSHQTFSALSFWRDCACRYPCPKQGASAD